MTPRVPRVRPDRTRPGEVEIIRARRGFFSTPDTVELQAPIESRVDRSGFVSPQVSNQGEYVTVGTPLPALSLLATGRFFSTQVAPHEYGDGDVADGLIVLIHKRHLTPEMRRLLRPTSIIRLTRREYGEEKRLYRMVTGNPYPEHVEYRIIPLVD